MTDKQAHDHGRPSAGKGMGHDGTDRRSPSSGDHAQGRKHAGGGQPDGRRPTSQGRTISGARPRDNRPRGADRPPRSDRSRAAAAADDRARFQDEKRVDDRPEGPSLTDRYAPEGEDVRDTEGLVIGRSAVRELLRSGRPVDKLLVRRGDREGSIVMLVAEAVARGIPVVEADRGKLDRLSGFVPHQGVIAMAAQKEYCAVGDILEAASTRGERPLIVIADGIADPYNLGALIRCAEGTGAHGLVIPRRRAVGLTALVSRASAGAMEYLPVAKVSNIPNTVRALQKEGVWVYAAEAGGTPYYQVDFTAPTAIVMGSEGDGVSHAVREICDGVVSIPMYGQINSFNVSTAAAVLLSEVARQRRS